jgi:hypothetical protein
MHRKTTIPVVEQLEKRMLFSTSFLSQLTPTPTVTASTVPHNGDENPYGVAFVPGYAAGGKLVAGDVLVSNFNSASRARGRVRRLLRSIRRRAHRVYFSRARRGLV